ncbi:MAG TPA: beta-ketoacyl synthase N-terminal-like domain-containing protein [Rhodocyclaceae bacterium]|nr:beta-ketoacyl synthase N-terminal-like domain-containing protein [Rhodocyclaceae bacterium]
MTLRNKESVHNAASGHIYIAGSGLSCALGDSLTTSVAALASGTAGPQRLLETPDGAIPFFAMEPAAPADHVAWLARARTIICKVVQEATGDAIRHAPLFIASSSLDMGAIERGLAYRTDAHAGTEEIASWLDWQGPVYWISTACTSSINALITASQMMRAGLCDDALVLGIELANDYTLRGFAAMQLLSPSAAQPLGADRDGLVLGEAVAALRLTISTQSGAQRWALLGGASVVSNKDATGASHEAVVSCWQQALQDGGLGSDGAIDLIKLQAAGSPGSDAIELAAVDTVFARTPALTSLKAHIGHTLGASGAAEIALLTASLEAGVWPAVQHTQDATLAHGLNNTAPAHCARLLASIIGFGGSHACVVLQDSHATRELPTSEVTTTPSVWEIVGRSGPQLAENWQALLAARLGQRPRRIGTWAEIGLHGALQCMDAAGEAVLPAGAILRIASLHGPMDAIRQTLQAIREDGIAMPFGFLQSQPGQLPAILAQALQWQGNARFVNQRSPFALIQTACCEAGPQGVLLGWLEESQSADETTQRSASSFWLRLRPVSTSVNASFASARLSDLQDCRYLRVTMTGIESAFE